MNTKRILLAVMCTLLVLTAVISGIVITKAGNMVSLLLGGFGANMAPGTTPSTPTLAPTAPPTEPPTAPPTEPPTEPTVPPTEPPHVHEMVVQRRVYATCTGYGYTMYACSCGKTEVGDFKDPLGHNLAAGYEVAPTCDKVGYTSRDCTRCNYFEQSNIVAATGHAFAPAEENAVVPPTCDADGYTLYICGTCQAERQQDIVPALGHSFGPFADVEVDREATCTRENCNVTVLESQLKITIHDAVDAHSSYIHVGTDAVQTVYLFVINDYRTEPTALEFGWDAAQGLKLSYDGKEVFVPTAQQGQVHYIDGIAPQTPTEPTEPSEPTDPSEPIEPSEPTDTTEPSEPTDTTEPSEPTDTTEPSGDQSQSDSNV